MDELDRRIAELGGYFPRLATYRRPTEDDLAALEADLAAPLPASYRAFLARYGGIAPYAGHWLVRPDAPDWPSSAVGIVEFVGCAERGLVYHRGVWRERVGDDLVPIATTQGGDPILIGTRGAVSGDIWLFSHDTPRPRAGDDAGPWRECLYRCAPSFDALLAALAIPDDNDGDPPLPGVPGYAAVLERSRAIAERTLPDPRALAIDEALRGFDHTNDTIARSWMGSRLHTLAQPGHPLNARHEDELRARLAQMSGKPPHGREVTAMVRRLVAIVAPPPPPPPPPSAPRRVRHATFGAGIVIATRDDKQVVRFDDGTERTLLGRFLVDD